MVKVVIAPQGFKGNLTALQVSQAIDSGIRRVVPGVVTAIVPMADGGRERCKPWLMPSAGM